ncbi:MAG TPA: APC family permease [Terriglobales bacterium]|nr:APC family permease [Terriglobales bacterium]
MDLDSLFAVAVGAVLYNPTPMQLEEKSPRTTPAAAKNSPSTDYGLRREILSPMETLAQSVSTIAPTTTPAATIPLVCALAGNGTWLAYALATVAVLLVALCIARYASHSASPGSLYTYASMALSPWLSATVAWSLLLAYVATGSSVIGGFYHYANILLRDATGHVYSAVGLATLVTVVSIWIAYRDVKISAELMLWIEATSVSVIVIVVALLLLRHGWHLDREQLHLHGMTGSGLRLGLVLALFSFVGFESATTLGSEARNPLHTIPRAVIQSAILAGVFFIVCAYAEVLGFHTAGQDLGASQDPMHVVARVGGVPVLGLLIDIGAMVSLFACTLGCITAAARVLLLMAHNGLAHDSLRAAHAKNQTPSRAVVITGAAALLPVAVLAARGASGLDVYGWLGSLATYGFIVAYALVCVALPRYLRDHGVARPGAQIVPWLAGAAMLLALVGNLYPVPEGPYGKLPYIYLAYLTAGLLWFVIRRRSKEAALARS